MKPKPVALPRPGRPERGMLPELETLSDPQSKLNEIMRRRDALAYELELIDAELEETALESICGHKDDTQDVELYDGTLGVSREFVDRHEPAIGQLQWLDDLAARFSGPGDSPGDVNGLRWGSGSLIAGDIFLSAGHCFDQRGGGWRRPMRDGVIIEPAEIATLMRVNFKYQIDGSNRQTRPGDPFPVLALLEYRLGNLDYAIVRLDRNAAGQLPGDLYGALELAGEDLLERDAMLCMIQHPAGKPKRIEAGPMMQNRGGQISYDSLDTLGASSGSPVIGPAGIVVGVHTNGGCSTFSGANFGVSIGAVRSASQVIQGMPLVS
ncbi:MAG: trypsin-like peptidase domain-containing protein [Rhodomicrobium sp.]|nr:trypsin-like peptidase domain-containing protein [Rhodomicrobium sp.]